LSIIVQKFGGTSMADPDRIGKAADRVVSARQAGHEVVVVVSAMGSTTDTLLALADEISADPCERERDMLVTVGERIATALLCMALQARGCESISFTGSQAGILTNDRHQDARIIEVRPIRVQDELSRGKVVVVAGYQGVSYKREITSLGRGGSDTTAIAMAAALDAEAVEIYSDVDGVFTADPRLVPEAVRLDEIDMDAMAALSCGGARVLAADAVAYARKAGIALYCRATDPRDGTGQTVVRRFIPGDPLRPRARAVTGLADCYSLIRCSHDVGRQILAKLADLHRAPVLVVSRDATVVLVVQAADAESIHAADSAQVESPVGLVTVVGQGLDRAPELLATVDRILDETGLPPAALTVEEHAIRAVVHNDSTDDIVAALHRELLENHADA